MNDSDAVMDRGSTSGNLYVVSTPIGNLEDITLRALSVLKAVNLIAAEHAARTKRLCRRYGVQTALTDYHQHNQYARTEQLIQKLKAGLDVALVTDAGTPGISDPGVYLVNRAAAENIHVRPVPGPSAVAAALSVSGLPTDGFVFIGFLSNKSGRRKAELRKLAAETRTLVIFEAPHRIREMLADVKEIFGARQMVMLREMTKVFEEVRRGSPDDILALLSPEKLKGEFTLVVAGCEAREEPKGLCEEAVNRIGELIRAGQMSIKDIAERISREEGVTYRQAYRACLEKKDRMKGERGSESVRKLKVRNSLGLHARSAAKIVELGRQYNSRLFLKKDGQEVDGGSILSILTLACPKGTEMEARTVGEDSERFMEKLSELFERKFGEQA